MDMHGYSGYTCMSANHLRPVGHDHEWTASTAQVTYTESGWIEGQVGVGPASAAVVSNMIDHASRVCRASQSVGCGSRDACPHVVVVVRVGVTETEVMKCGCGGEGQGGIESCAWFITK